MTLNLFNNQNTQPDKWSHLNQYEKKYLKEAIQAYDRIMETTDDILIIANRYQIDADDVSRAKNYAFGSGVWQYYFSPDLRMAEAWQRMSLGKETEIDEVLLRHEILESDLVINQGLNQLDAHQTAQAKYPWSLLITQTKNYE